MVEACATSGDDTGKGNVGHALNLTVRATWKTQQALFSAAGDCQRPRRLTKETA